MEKLTPQQDRIAELITRGYTAKEIASMLFIELETAQWHVKKLRKKMGAGNIADVARIYILSNPQKFFVTIVFLIMQSVISVVDIGLELRRPKPSRIIKTTRSGRKNNEFLVGDYE